MPLPMSGLTNPIVLEQIQQQFPDAVLNVSEPFGLLTLELKKQDVLPVMAFLRNTPALDFCFLTDLCGVHFPDQHQRELGVIYHLHSLVNNVRVRIKTFFPEKAPKMPSATTLFAAANWMERETYDFYGIVFDGHPDLRRILNVDEMDYFPMRKEYRLEDGTRTDKDDRYFGR